MSRRSHRRNKVVARPPHCQFKAWLDTRGRLNPPGVGNRLTRKRNRRWLERGWWRAQYPVVINNFNGLDDFRNAATPPPSCRVGMNFLLNTSGRTIRKGEMVMLTSLGTVDVVTTPPVPFPPSMWMIP